MPASPRTPAERGRAGGSGPRASAEGRPISRDDVLASAVQCIDDGVVIVDSEGRFLFVNEAAERIVGVGVVDAPPSEWASAYGCYLPDKVTPYPSELLPLARAMRGEHVREADIFIRNAENPSGVWISVNSSPLYDEAGELHGGVIVFRDATARKRSEGTVQRLSEAVERTTDSVFITDADGRIEYVNPAFEATTGYAREEALGRRPSILKSGKHDREHYERLWTHILAGKVHTGATINRKKSGELFRAEQTITPIRDEAGNLTHFVSLLRDVTEQRKAAERAVEMRLAREVQQNLYPSRPFVIDGLDVAGDALPADDTCGDYFDFIPMSNGSVAIAIGDVSGHGVGAALLMAETRAYVRSLARRSADLGEILTQLNTFLCHDTCDERFVTLLLARLDRARRRFVYASAGHIPGYLLDASGSVKLVLHSTSLPLGIFPGAEFTSSQELVLAEGDLLLLLTDGVTESQDGEEDVFGPERAVEVVAAQRQHPAERIVSGLCAAIKDFSSQAPQRDDITAVVCKVLDRPRCLD